jgi:hypothetical protein
VSSWRCTSMTVSVGRIDVHSMPFCAGRADA